MSQNNPSLNTTNPSQTSTPSKSLLSAADDESVYVLPKTYNGKTVTELFPEFKHDSVLRFSKLFGIGRTTSLPKIWKGTRKRKKKTSESVSNETFNNEDSSAVNINDKSLTHHQPTSKTLHTIHEEELPIDKMNEHKTTSNDAMDDDVFNLFDQDFSTQTTKKASEKPDMTQNDIELSKDKVNEVETEKHPEATDLVEVQKKLLQPVNDEPVLEENDEVQFLKPFIIDDKSIDKMLNKKDENHKENSTTKQDNDIWENGPASYWYNFYDLENLIEQERKKLEIEKDKQSKANLKKKKKNKDLSDDEEDDDDEDEDEEMDDKGDKSDEKLDNDKNKSEKLQTYDRNNSFQLMGESDALNLNQELCRIKEAITDEKFLLVNTFNWEDNIIVDINSAVQSSNRANAAGTTSNEYINERVKYAGWIPSGEHRTIMSFQSKVLGKKVDFLSQVPGKDQSVPSGKHSTSQANIAANLPNIWASIFPNDNYDLLAADWEKKIIINPDDINIVELKPVEFAINPSDDNLLIGVQDEIAIQEGQVNKDTGEPGTTSSSSFFAANQSQSTTEGQLKKDKLKMLENRANQSKSSLKNREEATATTNGDTMELAENDQRTNDATNNLPAETETKKFWNISNDEHYNPKAVIESTTVVPTTKHVSTALVLQHTQAALELNAQLFPTHLSTHRLRNFHRFPLKRFYTGVLSNENIFNCVTSLLRKFKPIEKPPQFQLSFSTTATPSTSTTCSAISTNESSSTSIKYANDLTAIDNCEIILAEYSEQYPPLMMQPGMATKIRNYYKKKFSKDEMPHNLDYGELVYVSSSPFLGTLKPGEWLQSLENLMFRAPIYLHKLPEHDFLVVRSKSSGYLLRSDVRNIFTVGQECPLIEVPGPNSKRSNSFLKDFLQAYLLRLFHESTDVPKRLKMEDVKKAFPTLAENSIRKRLKIIADFRRTGKSDTNWWILKEDFRLPSEEEIRNMVSPEQCCAYYSMLAAEQRLKDAGYGEKNLFASEDEDVDNAKIDDEVKNAPWHTTRSYLDAIKGKCLLQINGVADPTGRGEGFSYVRQAYKPNKQDDDDAAVASTPTSKAIAAAAAAAAAAEKEKQDLASASSPGQPQPPAKRTVTGTDADLRRLKLSKAKELLAGYGVPDHEIKKLKRWEIIDVVRTMSTQKAREGNGAAVSKFARGTRYSQSDAHEKFREECQRLFELQNRNLASEEVISTDEDEDLDEDSDVDEMGKNLESMLESTTANNNADPATSASTSQAAQSTEKPVITNPNDKSAELKSLIMNDANERQQQAGKKSSSNDADMPSNMHRILKITRTYRDEDTGQEYTKVEVVRKSVIIDAYVKIRTTRDDEFIRTAFALDETEKEKLRKEKRRLQEQLRRVKRNEAKQANMSGDGTPMLDENGQPIKPKVRKYNKTGLNRKPKAVKSSKFVNDPNKSETNTNQSSPDFKHTGSKSGLHYSSADEDRSLAALNDQSTNLLDSTANSSLNNTLTNSSQPVVTKRKYQKRKKLAIDGTTLTPSAPDSNTDSSLAAAPAGSAGLTKVEGTKLIIKKKAFMDGINVSPVKRKYTKKKNVQPPPGQEQQPAALSGDLMVVETTPNEAGDNANGDGPKLAPKLKIVTKAAAKKDPLTSEPKPIKITITKEKLAMSEPNISSPSLDTSELKESTPLPQTPVQQPPVKRQYNKQNSLLKKQQKLLIMQQQQQQLEKQQLELQQQQQQQQQEQLEMQFDPLMAAAMANLFDPSQDQQQQQQLLFQLLQQSGNPGLVFPPIGNNLFKQISSGQQLQSPGGMSQQQSQITPGQVQGQKRKSSTQNLAAQQCDYLVKPHKKVDRRHADPLVSLSCVLESILNELREMPEAQAFLYPVNSKKVPDYYKLIKNPVDLQMIRKRINEKIYKNRLSFADDVKLLVENSQLYNGQNHAITDAAESIYALCLQRLDEKSDQLTRLEKAINPLLDDNSVIAFNYLLDQIYEQFVITVENSFSFLKPVNKAKYKDYYDIIKNPIDLETIKQKIVSKKYKSRQEFVSDFELLYNNCVAYNGMNNSYTNTAQKMLDVCKQVCETEYGDQFQHLENEIALAFQQQNLDDGSNNNTPMRMSSRISVDALTDSESNMGMSGGPTTSGNLSYIDESIEQQRSSMASASFSYGYMENPPKKIKKANKNKQPQPQSLMNYDAYRPMTSSASSLKSNTNKSRFFSFGETIIGTNSSRNSPRSGSDVDVFVDIESVDEKINSSTLSKMMIADEHNFNPIYVNDNDETTGEGAQEGDDEDIVVFEPQMN